MQKLFLDSRILDNACRKKYFLTEEIMMENAARALKDEICRFYRKKKNDGKREILILCGGGNNGADGYALSRLLPSKFNVKIIECIAPKSPLCIEQKRRAGCCGICIESASSFLQKIESENDSGKNLSAIVDCIFGSGFKGDYRENDILLKKILKFANESNAFRLACDIPTGIRQDGTTVEDSAVFCADVTVSMGALKLCLFSDEAKDYAGKVKCAELGVPRALFENSEEKSADSMIPANTVNYWLLQKSDMNLPVRRKNLVNKGSFGHSFIALGEKSGAALIAASAALHFGSGLVTIIHRENSDLQKENNAPLESDRTSVSEFFAESKTPATVSEFFVENKSAVTQSELCAVSEPSAGSELCAENKISAPVSEFSAESKSPATQSELSAESKSRSCGKIFIPPEFLVAEEFSPAVTAVALGMGLGHDEEIHGFYFDFLDSHKSVKCVIDADLMYSKKLPAFLKNNAKNCVLTPHPKEFSSLLALCGLGEYSVKDCVRFRPALIEKFCRKFPDAVLLVKGANTMTGIFTEKDGFSLYVNRFGSPSLAKAGSGDVLSGLICALLAQGREPLDAAVTSTLAHGIAGSKIKQNYSLTPEKLINKVSKVSKISRISKKF